MRNKFLSDGKICLHLDPGLPWLQNYEKSMSVVNKSFHLWDFVVTVWLKQWHSCPPSAEIRVNSWLLCSTRMQWRWHSACSRLSSSNFPSPLASLNHYLMKFRPPSYQGKLQNGSHTKQDRDSKSIARTKAQTDILDRPLSSFQPIACRCSHVN